MRTMFISLVLIWSLAQLASTQTATTFKPEGCDRQTYACYVPERCLSSVTNPMTIAGSEIKLLKRDEEIKSDCEALFRFHVYDHHWAHVSVESFSPTATNIELYSKEKNALDKKTQFSCEKIDLGGSKYKYESKYMNAVKENTEKDNSKFKCTFEVLLKNTISIFKFALNDLLILKVDNDETRTDGQTDYPKYGQTMCNPLKVTANRNSWNDRKKVYSEVAYEFGRFSCKDPTIFKIEFRKEPEPGQQATPFEKIDELKCLGSGKVGTIDESTGAEVIKATEDDDFEIRCVADAHFFCKDGVKNKPGKPALNHVASDWTTRTLSSLKCPPEALHLVVKEDEKPLKNAEFECLSYGETQFWTVKDSTITLDKDDVAYCTNDLECRLQLKIQESSVIYGDLDETKFVPKCFDKGELHVKDGDDKIKINPPYCNLKTGNFEYTHHNKQEPQEISESTKFICIYPQEKDETIDSASVQKVVAGSIGGFIGAGAVAFVIILVLAFLATRKEKKAREQQKKLEAKNKKIGDVAWMHYCLDDEEKKAYTKKMLGLKDGDVVATDDMITPPAPDEECTYNKMLMTFQYKALEFAGAKLVSVTKTKDNVTTQKEEARVEIEKHNQTAPFAADPDVAAANKTYTLWREHPAKTVRPRKVQLPEQARKRFNKAFGTSQEENDVADNYIERDDNENNSHHRLTKEEMRKQIAELKKA